MLRLPEGLMGDKKANNMVERYAHQRIFGMVKAVIKEYAFRGVDSIKTDDEEFIELVSEYFPPRYPRHKMGETFLSFYALLEAKDKFVPELVMEYIMASLIEASISAANSLGRSTIEEMKPADREYVLSKLVEECEDMLDDIDESAEGSAAMAKKRLNAIEDLREYEELYFWDVDYDLLNFLTEDELRESAMNAELGIGLKPKNHVFVIPKEWYQ